MHVIKTPKLRLGYPYNARESYGPHAGKIMGVKVLHYINDRPYPMYIVQVANGDLRFAFLTPMLNLAGVVPDPAGGKDASWYLKHHWPGPQLEGLGDNGDDEEEWQESPQCPMCGGEGMSMGRMGRKTWYRCRQCGWQFSEEGDE